MRCGEVGVKPRFHAAPQPQPAGVQAVGVGGDGAVKNEADAPVGEAACVQELAGLGAGEEFVTHGIQIYLFSAFLGTTIPNAAGFS